MALNWRQDSVKAIRAKKEAAAKAEALNAQTQVAVMAFCATATNITDAQALQMSDLFPAWEDLLAAGNKLAENTGLRGVYRPIDESHAGTLEDPIPWVYGMDCHAGTYFSYNGHVYQVAEGGDMVPCVWPPDTAGLWQWVLIE